MKTTDGTPDAVKIACPVWNGGKDGDNFKVLPIIIDMIREQRFVYDGENQISDI